MNTQRKTKPPPLPTQIIRDHLDRVRSESFRGNEWGARHCQAWHGTYVTKSTVTSPTKKVFESGIRDAIVGWAKIGEAHLVEYGSRMGDDGVLGPAWAAMGKGLIDLLNGQLGQLDGGTLDRLIRDIAEVCGVNLEE